MFLSTDFAFRTSCHGPHLHATLRIISRGVSGLATDSPCGVWGRGWSTCLLHNSLLLGSHFKIRVGMQVSSDISYIYHFLPLFTVSCMKPVIFLLCNNLFIYQVLCTLIYRRRSLHSFLMNKLRAYFRVICSLIPSWSDISVQHFPSLQPGELCFWRPKISSRRPEILYRLINMYQLKILSCTSHLVAMSAMPPVDNYVTIYIFIEKPWQALEITMVGVYDVQMWKWIVMIFLCDISGARGMLVIAQSLAITAPQREEMADCWRPMLRKK